MSSVSSSRTWAGSWAFQALPQRSANSSTHAGSSFCADVCSPMLSRLGGDGSVLPGVMVL